MQRYFLHLSYKGTHYSGWQVQPGQRTVQEMIERALTQLNSNKKVEVTGCGRTDTGVHASNFYAHADLETQLSPADLRHKLNGMLPDDIAIHTVFETAANAHARFDASSRTYEYHIHTSKNPFIAETSWYFNTPLHSGKIREACALIARHTDFECFSKVHTDVSNFNCTIHSITWDETPHGYCFTIRANRFLRNMVRAIVGTLINVGLEKITPADVEDILNSGDRSKAGMSVPAQGLTLVQVDYPFLTGKVTQ